MRLLNLIAFSCHLMFSGIPAILVAADGVDIQHFRPSANGLGLFGLDSPDALKAGQPSFGLTFNYADTTLAVINGDESDGDVLVDFQLAAQIQGAVGITSWFELGVDIPILLAQSGTALDGTALTPTTFGDVRIAARLAVLSASRAPIGLSVVVPLSLSTGNSAAYVGENSFTVAPKAVFGAHPGRFDWVMSLGYRIRPPMSLIFVPSSAKLDLGNELTYGASLAFYLNGAWSLGIEGEGALGSDLASLGQVDDPFEARAGIKYRARTGLAASAGFARGITGGYGNPAWRVFFGTSFALGGVSNRERDRDNDGFVDRQDSCLSDAEDRDGFQDHDGCPELDNDNDGIPDANDRCPSVPEVVNGVDDVDGCPDLAPDRDNDGIADFEDKCLDVKEDLDGFEDKDGCPEADNDADGVLDGQDRCPADQEDRDGMEDDDGCPDLDDDRDGINEPTDRCPKQAETLNGFEDEDGCPDKGPAKTTGEKTPKPTPTAAPTTPAPSPETTPALAATKAGTAEKTAPSSEKASSEAKENGSDLKSGATGGASPATPPAASESGGASDTASSGKAGASDKSVGEQGSSSNKAAQSPASKAAPAASPTTPTTNPAASPQAGFETTGSALPGDIDGDGLPDLSDKCPKKPETRNGYADDDGCPEIDSDRDGIVDGIDRCKAIPETINGFKDDDGCPEGDLDDDLILDELDRCPKIAETRNGYEDGDGCPDTAPSQEMLDIIKKKTADVTAPDAKKRP